MLEKRFASVSLSHVLSLRDELKYQEGFRVNGFFLSKNQGG